MNFTKKRIKKNKKQSASICSKLIYHIEAYALLSK